MSTRREYRDKSQKKEILLLVASDVAPGIVREAGGSLTVMRCPGVGLPEVEACIACMVDS